MTHPHRLFTAAAAAALLALPACELPGPRAEPARSAPTTAPAGDTTLLGLPPEAEREPLLKKHTAEQLGGGATPADFSIEESAWDELGVRWTAIDQRYGTRYEGNSALAFKKVYVYPEPTDSPN